MISIIIPILNEAESIESLLFHLIEQASQQHRFEIIIVDGGSSDGSQNIVSEFISGRMQSKSNRDLSTPLEVPVSIIHSLKGRAKQMNLGAKKAIGHILYFLHADSFPPKNYDQLIINEVNRGNQAGCFRLQFDSNHWWLRLASWLTQFSWRACRGGDQSLFITNALFKDIGGYDEDYIIYEDNMLINELYKRKQFIVINKKIQTSSRLYEKHGVWKLQYHFWSIYVKKWFGASADDLYLYYKKHIS